jgi:branched-chain amino acid transport system ATP-binding protein
MLELSDIEAGYGRHRVLRGVDLVVPDDAVVALIGPNGVGKTTLLNVVAGTLPPTSGRVLVDDLEITGLPPHQRAQAGICYVPAGRGIFPSLTVEENLRLQVPAKDRRFIEEAVDAFPRLGERYRQAAGTMSGGEQQMLALARAYVAHPSLILVDEVSMGLAPAIVDEIFLRLRQLAERGAALLIVEQYVSRALALADYVYVMSKGRIAFCGEAGEVDERELEASYLGKAIS